MRDREISGAGLDVRLAHGRTDLLDSIDQPPLARIRDRAAVRRRRRRAAGSGGAGLLCAAVAATLLLQPWTADGTDPPPPPVAEAPPGGPVYTAAGITINGLTGTAVTGVPGTISDVEFVDPDHGYLLARCPASAPCPASLARTADGGLTWQHTELSWATAGADLTGFPDGTLMITSGANTHVSADQGRNWQPVAAGSGAERVPATAEDLLRAGPGGRCGLAVEVWRPTLPRAGTAPTDPDLDVCWVAPAATADGAWWVGGTRDGNAAVAVTRDRGAHWRTVTLPGTGVPAGPVEATSLGAQAYATVLDTDRKVLALFHSSDGGQSFVRTRSGGPAAPQGVSGTPVPLLDGRLLVAGTDRYFHVSTDRGATFSRAEGNLPVVGRLSRTVAGYVAYDLFGSGWAAYSADGATWRKLQIN